MDWLLHPSVPPMPVWAELLWLAASFGALFCAGLLLAGVLGVGPWKAGR